MSDLFTQTAALPGLWVILAATLVAGVVYGFAGFGSALIVMPVAAAYIPLEIAVAAFSVSAISSAFTVLPRAVRQVDRKGTTVMIAAAVPFAALGIRVLKTTDLTVLRWAVVIVASATLAALVTGWRYKTVPGLRTRAGVGAATGFLGGATGLLGPIVILFQLASQDGAARSRASTLVFLTVTSVLLLPLMALQGLLTPTSILLGFYMFLPYAFGTRLGQAVFNPAREGVYRVVAYVMIGVAILLGVPL